MREWLKHAFAVDPPGPAEPAPPQAKVVDKICTEVVRRHLTTPALTFLEMSRPLNFVGAQAMHFFTPLIDALIDAEGHRQFAKFLEQRGSIDYICRRIEELEANATRIKNHESRIESQTDGSEAAHSSS